MYVYTLSIEIYSFIFLSLFCQKQISHGELAQLARASALQAEGQGFESPILHYQKIIGKWDSSSVG